MLSETDNSDVISREEKLECQRNLDVRIHSHHSSLQNVARTVKYSTCIPILVHSKSNNRVIHHCVLNTSIEIREARTVVEENEATGVGAHYHHIWIVGSRSIRAVGVHNERVVWLETELYRWAISSGTLVEV
jgi:hypothetical protein